MAERRSAGEWAEIVAEWRQSGLSGRDFAEAIGTTATTLSWWAWKLGQQGNSPRRRKRKRAAVASTAAVSFLPVRVTLPMHEGAEVSETPIELVVEGHTVRVRRGFDSATLEKVLTVLGRSAC